MSADPIMGHSSPGRVLWLGFCGAATAGLPGGPSEENGDKVGDVTWVL